MVASRGDILFVKLGYWNLMRLSLVYQPSCYAAASLSELLDSGRLVSGVLQAYGELHPAFTLPGVVGSSGVHGNHRPVPGWWQPDSQKGHTLALVFVSIQWLHALDLGGGVISLRHRQLSQTGQNLLALVFSVADPHQSWYVFGLAEEVGSKRHGV